jgi:hypothetical protein
MGLQMERRDIYRMPAELAYTWTQKNRPCP